MSVNIFASRISSVESNVDELEIKADSSNVVFAGVSTINGPAFLNTVSFGSTISGLNVADVNGFSDALGSKAPKASPTFTGTVTGITKSMVGLDKVDNTADNDKPFSTAMQNALNAKSSKQSPTFTGFVIGITK